MSRLNVGDNRPTPEKFMEFIPWACNQLQLPFVIMMHKELQHEYVSVVNQEKKKNKTKVKLQSRVDLNSDHKKDGADVRNTAVAADANVIHILATCDHADNLTRLTFEKNATYPRTLWNIIGLIVKYQSYLVNITIHGGLNHYGLYEISKFLKISNITQLILDNSVMPEPNFYLLLESDNEIYHLSLAGCEINDHAIEKMAENLTHPLPASKKLKILNLASNRITDDGAKSLADALRSNRRLIYLNLSNNILTDDGAGHIFNSLTEFVLTEDELRATKTRNMEFLKKKSDFTAKAMQELKSGDLGKPRRRTVRAVSAAQNRRGKLEKEVSLRSFVEAKSFISVDVILYEKAVAMAEYELGAFKDPFNSRNTEVRNTNTYCFGNNALSYLNLSYNNLSYISLRKIVDLLQHQKSLSRKPSGLVNLIVEGNPLPIVCDELIQIDQLVESGFSSLRRMSIAKKRLPGAKR